LDLDRSEDNGHYMAAMLRTLSECTTSSGLETHLTGSTWRSFVSHGDNGLQQHARLDHMYSKGFVAESTVLADSTTDHRPVVNSIRGGDHVAKADKLASLKRRNFKAIGRKDLRAALNLHDW
jgi:hypothetical protein